VNGKRPDTANEQFMSVRHHYCVSVLLKSGKWNVVWGFGNPIGRRFGVRKESNSYRVTAQEILQ